MFLESQTKKSLQYYQTMLTTIGSLSRLFSDGEEPYIQYRIAENLFCRSFDAKNLSRSDVSADASKDNVGIGIKTFLEKNSASLQKVAEFNKEAKTFRDLDIESKVLRVAEMRNRRIEATKTIHGLDSMIYHCVTRAPRRIFVYETEMDTINIDKIGGISPSKNGNTIYFRDAKNEYTLNLTKSTLFKRFITPPHILELSTRILDDPFDELEKMFLEVRETLHFAPIKKQTHVFLPLYSTRTQGEVPTKSGLNQWNAGGRARHANEVYIPIPKWIHKKFPKFFPPRDEPFDLKLPNGETISAKVCQDGSKALMSNPNIKLGTWILRDILRLKEGELVTYDKLQEIGLDSVVLYKNEDSTFEIDFTKLDSFEVFKSTNH